VAVVGLQYPGTSFEDAMTKFATKLARSVPSMKCVSLELEREHRSDAHSPSTDE
jgi:hypothetical protein